MIIEAEEINAVTQDKSSIANRRLKLNDRQQANHCFISVFSFKRLANKGLNHTGTGYITLCQITTRLWLQ
jgi:hypothetical protein